MATGLAKVALLRQSAFPAGKLHVEAEVQSFAGEGLKPMILDVASPLGGQRDVIADQGLEAFEDVGLGVIDGLKHVRHGLTFPLSRIRSHR